jgi:pimeloyl-ACP methyl ester carboxylesterase
MSEEADFRRRRFLGTASMIIAAARFGAVGSAEAQPGKTRPADVPTIRPGTNTSFVSMKQITAGVLNVGYAEAGPADGSVVILLHGWPYDIHSFADVAPLLASAGYRVIVPYLRGYGTTRFLSKETFRNGQQAAFAVDIIALMDALGIQQAILAGYDWGARTANIVAALWPERCKAMVSVSGYLIGNPQANTMPLPPKAELQWWYQYYFATERGQAGYDQYRHDFAKLIWQIASPKWDFDDVTFDRTAASFNNPDHVAIVIHNYRWRLGLAEGERQYDDLEKRLAESPVIAVPTITLEGDANGAPTPRPRPMPRSSRANMHTGSSMVASVTICLRRRRRPLPKLSSKSITINRRRCSVLRSTHIVLHNRQARDFKSQGRVPCEDVSFWQPRSAPPGR